jgi:hypothetical protein
MFKILFKIKASSSSPETNSLRKKEEKLT